MGEDEDIVEQVQAEAAQGLEEHAPAGGGQADQRVEGAPPRDLEDDPA